MVVGTFIMNHYALSMLWISICKYVEDGIFC